MPYKDPKIAKIKKREWYLEHRREISIKNQIFRENNKEYCKIKDKERYLKRREKILEQKKQIYLHNIEKFSQKNHIYYIGS